MKKLFIRRILASLIDNIVVLGFLVFLFSLENWYSVLLSASLGLIYLLIVEIKYNSWSIGKFLFGLKLVFSDTNINNTKKIFILLSRKILGFISFCSFGIANFFYFGRKKKDGLFMIDNITKTTIIDKKSEFKDFEQDFKIYSLIMFLFLNLVSFFFILQISNGYIEKKKTNIQEEFNLFIDKNLTSIGLDNIEFNKAVKKCIWEKDEKILGLPEFVFKFIYVNKIGEEVSREEYLVYFNEAFFSECIESVYPQDFLQKKIN